MVPHLPHVRVVVVRLDLAGVDLFAPEGPESGALGDDRLLTEDAVVRRAGERRLHQVQACREKGSHHVYGPRGLAHEGTEGQI